MPFNNKNHFSLNKNQEWKNKKIKINLKYYNKEINQKES
jgi:hypothetical protein